MDYISNLRKYIGTQPIIMCGACVIIVNDKNEILLHHRTDRDWWVLPGGAMKVEKSEGRAAKFYNINELPSNLSNPIKPILKDYIEKIINN